MTQATSRPEEVSETDVDLYKRLKAAVDGFEELVAESAARNGKLNAYLAANQELAADLRQKPAPTLVRPQGGVRRTDNSDEAADDTVAGAHHPPVPGGRAEQGRRCLRRAHGHLAPLCHRRGLPWDVQQEISRAMAEISTAQAFLAPPDHLTTDSPTGD